MTEGLELWRKYCRIAADLDHVLEELAERDWLQAQHVFQQTGDAYRTLLLEAVAALRKVVREGTPEQRAEAIAALQERGISVEDEA